jgi:hypothetical protein
MAVGAWAGLEHAYSTARDTDLQRLWVQIVVYAVVGNAAYLFGVVSNYIEIRGSRTYRREFFDGWWMVLAVRLFLIATICVIAWLKMRVLTRAAPPPTGEVKAEGREGDAHSTF